MIKEYFRNYLWNTCDVTVSLGRASTATFHNHHDEEDWNVTLAETGPESGTAHRVKLIQRYLAPGESFMLTYGDGLSDVNCEALLASHRQSGKVLTMSAVHPAGRFGWLHLSADGALEKFHEKPTQEANYVNGGFMACDYKLFEYLAPCDESAMFEAAPVEALVRDGQLNCYRHEGFWQPMDTYQECQYLNRLWTDGKAPWA
jgi:glucose-1-phosphate cytidylyltransferase